MATDDLRNKEKFLLEKKEELLLKILITDKELEYINSRMTSAESDKNVYEKYRNEEIKRYLKNLLQVAGTGAMVDTSIHVVSHNFDNFKTSDWVIIFSYLYIAGLLTVDLILQINNYKKNNEFDSKKSLEEKQETLEKEQERNNLEMSLLTLELDSIDKMKYSENKVKRKYKEKRYD